MGLPWFINVYHIIILHVGLAKHHGFCQFAMLAFLKSIYLTQPYPTLDESGPKTHWKACFFCNKGASRVYGCLKGIMFVLFQFKSRFRCLSLQDH